MSNLEDSSCILCGNRSMRPIRHYRGPLTCFRDMFVCQCEHCTLLQAAPLPTVQQLFAYYNQTYRSSGNIGYKEKSLTVRHASQAEFARDILVESGISLQNVIDIGAGHGQLLNCFRNLYPEAKYYATEIDAACCNQLIALGIDARLATLDDSDGLPFNHRFDLVFCSHVLEHSCNPKLFLQRILDMLSEKGLALIEVPNCGVPYPYGDDSPHISFFSEQTFQDAILGSGFEIVRLMTGGISATEYVPHPTVKTLALDMIRVLLRAVPLSDNVLLKATDLITTITGHPSHAEGAKKFLEHEEYLETKYRSAFFSGSKDGTFLRAMVRKGH
jgi:2-polyprenyl-3-methyl-5-hydroxy-6-metoxy-1,4-benzoquinol methylase